MAKPIFERVNLVLWKHRPKFDVADPLNSFQSVVAFAKVAGFSDNEDHVRFVVRAVFTPGEHATLGWTESTAWGSFDEAVDKVKTVWNSDLLMRGWMLERVSLLRAGPGDKTVEAWARQVMAVNLRVKDNNSQEMQIMEIMAALGAPAMTLLLPYGDKIKTWGTFLPLLGAIGHTLVGSSVSSVSVSPALAPTSPTNVVLMGSGRGRPGDRRRFPFFGSGGRRTAGRGAVGGRGRRNVICYTCGRPGHISTQCNSVSTSNVAVSEPMPPPAFSSSSSPATTASGVFYGMAMTTVPLPTSFAGAFYAVAKGRQIGVFDNWPGAKQSTDGYSGSLHRKFDTLEAAEEWLYDNVPQSESLAEDLYLSQVDDGINGSQ